MIVLTADQIVEPADAFNATIGNAAPFLESHPDQLVAFGVEAASPSTQVGCQKLGPPIDFPSCEVRKIVALTGKPALEIAHRHLEKGGYCWNSGQFACKAEAILAENNAYMPEAGPLLARIGEAWNTARRDQVLAEFFPRMPRGSIDYNVMQKTDLACSTFLPCSWQDMGTYAALAGRIGVACGGNPATGKVVIRGNENFVLANTGQYVVVASDDRVVVVTDNTVSDADRNTDMKAPIELAAEEARDIV